MRGTGSGDAVLRSLDQSKGASTSIDPIATKWLPDGTLVWCSPAYARLFKRTVDEMVGTKWPEAAAAFSRMGKTWAHMRRIVRHFEDQRNEIFLSDESLPPSAETGSWLRWIEWPLRDASSGELEMVLSVAVDVSELYEAHRAIAAQVELQEKVRKRDMELVAEHLHSHAVQELVAARWVVQSPDPDSATVLDLIDRALETTRSSVGVLGSSPGAIPDELRESFVIGTASAVVDGWLRPSWLTDSLVEAITVLTPSRIVWWSPSAEALFGRTAYEYGMDWAPVLHPDDVADITGAMSMAFRGVSASLTWRFLHETRGELTISSRFVPMPDIDGEPTAAITSMDVTDVANARKETSAVASVWADVVKGLPFAVVLVGDDGVPVEGNAEARRLFAAQLGKEGVDGWGPTPRLWGRQVERLVSRSIRAQQPFEWEFPSVGVLVVDVISRPVLLAPERPGRVVVIRNMSALSERHRQAEAELERWRSVIESFVVAFAVVRTDGWVVAVNRVARDLFGVEFDERSGVVTRNGQQVSSVSSLAESLGLAPQEVVSMIERAEQAPDGTDARVVRVEGLGAGALWLRLQASRVPSIGGDLWVLAVRDVTEEQVAFERVEMLNAELSQTVASLERVRAREREAMAQRIHDDGLQRLTSLMWTVQGMDVPYEQREQLLGGLRGLESSLRTELASAFVPAQEMGVADTLRELCGEQHLPVVVEVADSCDKLPAETAGLLIRSVREALRNVERHANASSCRVAVACETDRVRVSVCDDGDGFDTERLGEAIRGGHVGLVSMRESVREAGGRWTVSSDPSTGTSVEFWLPVSEVLR